MKPLEPTSHQKPDSGPRRRLFEIVFESDTPSGRRFDIGLIWAILLSLALVMLESMRDLRAAAGPWLVFGEWFFTILFTIELSLRLYVVRHPLKYLFSFFGLVDLLAVVPTYLSLVIPGAQALLTVRAFRLLRVFRIFKLSNYMGEARVLSHALRASRPKIIVFLGAVSATVVSMGALMYLVEGEGSGFTSIPRGIYWAIVTMTTVGFGDITPHTALGQFLASCLMILGYGIIAIPTGIVTSELTRHNSAPQVSGQTCPACGKQGHDIDARHCKFCGALL